MSIGTALVNSQLTPVLQSQMVLEMQNQPEFKAWVGQAEINSLFYASVQNLLQRFPSMAFPIPVYHDGKQIIVIGCRTAYRTNVMTIVDIDPQSFNDGLHFGTLRRRKTVRMVEEIIDTLCRQQPIGHPRNILEQMISPADGLAFFKKSQDVPWRRICVIAVLENVKDIGTIPAVLNMFVQKTKVSRFRFRALGGNENDAFRLG